MALSYNLGYQESISKHPTKPQIFAGKPYSTFPSIWQWLVYNLKKQFKVQIIGILEEIDSFCDQKYIYENLGIQQLFFRETFPKK